MYTIAVNCFVGEGFESRIPLAKQIKTLIEDERFDIFYFIHGKPNRRKKMKDEVLSWGLPECHIIESEGLDHWVSRIWIDKFLIERVGAFKDVLHIEDDFQFSAKSENEFVRLFKIHEEEKKLNNEQITIAVREEDWGDIELPPTSSLAEMNEWDNPFKRVSKLEVYRAYKVKWLHFDTFEGIIRRNGAYSWACNQLLAQNEIKDDFWLSREVSFTNAIIAQKGGTITRVKVKGIYHVDKSEDCGIQNYTDYKSIKCLRNRGDKDPEKTIKMEAQPLSSREEIKEAIEFYW